MLLVDVETLIAERPICNGTQNQYRRSVRCYSDFLGLPADREHLQELPVNRWLKSLDGRKSPPTIRGRKAGITAIWNWLAETGSVPHYNPNRLRRINVPQKAPRAWSVQNVQALLRGADDVAGELRCGLNAADMLRAWIWIGYESGIRPGDILALASDQIGNRVTITQHKTGKLHTFTLSPAAMDAIARIARPGEQELFGVPRSTARRWEAKLFEAAAKYGFVRRKGQGLGTLRKAHGTEVARTSGIEAAAQSLGHVSGTLIARQSYVEPDALRDPPRPPSLSHARPDSSCESSRTQTHCRCRCGCNPR